MDRFITWLKNARHYHHRVMMRYLKRRGWVVFYLEEGHRKCNNKFCWLSLYNDTEFRDVAGERICHY